MLIKIDKNTYIEFNEKTKISKTIFKDQMENDIKNLEKSKIPSDDQLLKWAKQNHPDILSTNQNLEQAEEIRQEISMFDSAIKL